MRDKLNPKIERRQQFRAFEIYRDLGYKRTFREVARQAEVSPGTICKWAKMYKWDERLAQYSATVAKRKEAGALLRVDDPIAEKLVDAMDRIDAVIDSAFIREADGNILPTITVKNADELTKLIAEYRKFLETYSRFVAAYMPVVKEKDRGTHIKEFNVNIGNVSQEERIEILKGMLSENEPSGNKQSTGGIQDADFEQVSERGDEDGLGRDGVSGSPPNSDSGD